MSVAAARREAPEQTDRAMATAADLSAALEALAATARKARSQRADRHPDIFDVHAAYRAVVAAEEAHDIAVLDVRSAAGEDV